MDDEVGPAPTHAPAVEIRDPKKLKSREHREDVIVCVTVLSELDNLHAIFHLPGEALVTRDDVEALAKEISAPPRSRKDKKYAFVDVRDLDDDYECLKKAEDFDGASQQTPPSTFFAGRVGDGYSEMVRELAEWAVSRKGAAVVSDGLTRGDWENGTTSVMKADAPFFQSTPGKIQVLILHWVKYIHDPPLEKK